MYDIVVVGGGHAGCEAALAAANLGLNTALVTGNLNMVASMPCNPSIGGPAKGIVVREIDALGGYMGKNADLCQIQTKLLNSSKGPAVQALRFQIDKLLYVKEMLKHLKATPNLTLVEALVESLIVTNNEVKGVILENGEKLEAKKVIITTGTYLNSRILRGKVVTQSGPDEQKTTFGISKQLSLLGFPIVRLKTGTPARIYTSSIDFSKASVEAGSKEVLHFSHDEGYNSILNVNVDCYLIHTNQELHNYIIEHLSDSAMYGGVAEGVGPRYCPSIEDKIVRFKDKERHQLFLEPESLELDDTYIQGFSTSMSVEVQDKMLRMLPGFADCKVKRYAYAIEYDAIDPTYLYPTLETKLVKGLYTAGQINGTSGYEEAAGQGLMAGINASLSVLGKEPLILKRDEAYIGVMIDDLVTKGTKEPYRLLSSRSEYRLLTRSDNADMRLMEKGYEVGLNSEERYQKFLERKRELERGIEVSKHIYVGNNKQVSSYCAELGFEKVDPNTSYFDLIKRQGVNYYKLSQLEDRLVKLDSELSYKLEIEVKYEGYIRLQLKEVERMHQYEGALLPSNIDYHHIDGLSLEAREALDKIRPGNIGEAMRITSVHPSDINVLLLYIRNYSKKNGL